MKKSILVLLTAVFAIGLAGCETTKGVGKDIQNAGEKMEQAVEGKKS
ncbi:entericidin A/B family lipoprotein [Pelistega sp. MC2]|nr:entericidin A/B family lipoprotein [Pelistega sp. MC2]